MSKKIFGGLKASMLEAIAFAEGDKNKAKIHKIDIPMVDVKSARQNLHMSQDEFATVLCIPVSTLRKWEQGQRRPDAATRLLLQVIVHEPRAVEKTLITLMHESPIGLRITPYDPDFKRQIKLVRHATQKRRNVLRELAK